MYLVQRNYKVSGLSSLFLKRKIASVQQHSVNYKHIISSSFGIPNSFSNSVKYFSKMVEPTVPLPSKEELLKKLTPLQYHITQQKGTERPFTGAYNKTTDPGSYSCIVCGQYLFSSNTKFDSGCGWPAFNDVLDKGLVKLSPDTSGVGANLLLLIANPGRVRTEVQCAKCDAHLGHVFDDGPKPTGKRYCINSAAIHFHPKEDK